LPSKHKALSSISSIEKKRKKERKKRNSNIISAKLKEFYIFQPKRIGVALNILDSCLQQARN
jgi:hypothetical protein